MDNNTCIICKKLILKKNEFVLGHKKGVIGFKPCHQNCYEEYRNNFSFLKKPVTAIKPKSIIFLSISIFIISILVLLIIPSLPSFGLKILGLLGVLIYVYMGYDFYKYYRAYMNLKE